MTSKAKKPFHTALVVLLKIVFLVRQKVHIIVRKLDNKRVFQESIYKIVQLFLRLYSSVAVLV